MLSSHTYVSVTEDVGAVTRVGGVNPDSSTPLDSCEKCDLLLGYTSPGSIWEKCDVSSWKWQKEQCSLPKVSEISLNTLLSLGASGRWRPPGLWSLGLPGLEFSFRPLPFLSP